MQPLSQSALLDKCSSIIRVLIYIDGNLAATYDQQVDLFSF